MDADTLTAWSADKPKDWQKKIGALVKKKQLKKAAEYAAAYDRWMAFEPTEEPKRRRKRKG